MDSLRHEDEKQLQTETQEKSLAYGCLFCKTGKEQSVINRIHISCPEVRAITMRKIKYRTCKKIKRTEEPLTQFRLSALTA